MVSAVLNQRFKAERIVSGQRYVTRNNSLSYTIPAVSFSHTDTVTTQMIFPQCINYPRIVVS